jgi:uncharacterized protein (TIGR01777 family)
MRVAITGSSGLIGSALRRSLEGDGHEVVAVVRPGSTASGATVAWDLERRTIDADALRAVDAVVHLAGEPIGGKRWNAEQKRKVLESRTVSTALLAETLATFGGDGPGTFVSGSAIGYYGDRGDEVLTETSGPQPGLFLSDVAIAWEAAAQPAIDAGVRTAFARTGIVLDREEGALAKLVPLFKLFVGGRMGSGRQWMAWVALDDEVAALRFLLDTPSATGPFNLTAPNPATNAELSKAIGKALGRPSFVPVPRFGPKLLLGPEMADQLLFASQRVHPAALDAAGFTFRHPTLEPAVRAILGK